MSDPQDDVTQAYGHEVDGDPPEYWLLMNQARERSEQKDDEAPEEQPAPTVPAEVPVAEEPVPEEQVRARVGRPMTLSMQDKRSPQKKSPRKRIGPEPAAATSDSSVPHWKAVQTAMQRRLRWWSENDQEVMIYRSWYDLSPIEVTPQRSDPTRYRAVQAEMQKKLGAINADIRAGNVKISPAIRRRRTK